MNDEDREKRETEVRRAEAAHARAMTGIREFKSGRNGAGLEAVYGQTYQHLVRLGERRQIRLKYRRA